MPSLDESFETLRQRLKDGNGLRNTGDDPVFYLIFRPDQMLEAKRCLKQWKARLNLDGWTVHTFSMAEVVHDILQNHPLRDFWLMEEEQAPLDFTTINKTLQEALSANQDIDRRLLEKIESIRSQDRALLLVTDIEALHPYLRIGSIEQRLQGKFHVPTVILYPGKRSGEYSLSFLGIYPEDGNYRSIHIGG